MSAERKGGAACGVAVGTGVAFLTLQGLREHWWLGLLPALGAAGLILALYSLADRAWAVGRHGRGQVALGGLVGANAAFNAVAGWRLVGAAASEAAGVAAAAILGGLVLASASDSMARDRRYQAVLGWSNLILPMSWPVTALGVGMLLVSLAAWAPFPRSPHLRISAIRIHAGSGTLFVIGGLFGNHIPRRSTGFDMGNVAFLKASAVDARPYLVMHEAGHALSLGALGWVFHAIGGIDENLVGRGWRAYAERLAESHVAASAPRNALVPLWGD